MVRHDLQHEVVEELDIVLRIRAVRPEPTYVDDVEVVQQHV